MLVKQTTVSDMNATPFPITLCDRNVKLFLSLTDAEINILTEHI